MMEPVEPSKEDCCNNGCDPCIFDVYDKQMKLFKKTKEIECNPINFQSNGISQIQYTSFVVTETKEISQLHKLIKFKRKLKGNSITWKPGSHFFVFLKLDDEKFSRAYTPIKLSSQLREDYDFSIFIKLYDFGVVSKYLFNLIPNDVTLWRGPYGSCDIIPNKYENIVMIGQGTGVAPLMSIIDSILRNEDDMARVFLHYCCSSIDQILFRDELYSFKSYWNFNYSIYISEFNLDTSDYRYEEPIRRNKLTCNLVEHGLTNQYFICGSTDFMKVYQTYLISNNISTQNIILF